MASNYKPGQSVTDAWKAYQRVNAAKPGAYQSSWQDELEKLYGQISQRKPFEYDLNADSLYQQYKDQYSLAGQQAMQDTMGQAAALTGGYGNSYAQTAGQQTYQGYMQKLNEVIPQLEQRAYGRYRDEGQDLYNLYGLTQGNEDRDYGRYRDQVGDWRDERGFAYGAWSDERGFDYGAYQDDLAQQNWQTQFDYSKAQDALAQQNWQTQFDYQKEQDAIAMAAAKRGGGGRRAPEIKFTEEQIGQALSTMQSGGEDALMRYTVGLEGQGYSEASTAWLYNYARQYAKQNKTLWDTISGVFGR